MLEGAAMMDEETRKPVVSWTLPLVAVGVQAWSYILWQRC